MSIMQMFLLAYNNGEHDSKTSYLKLPFLDDWKDIFSDFTKFGLGLISLLFDLLFICQHYIFYRGSVSFETQHSALDDDDDDPNVDGQRGSDSIHVPYVEADERRAP